MNTVLMVRPKLSGTLLLKGGVMGMIAGLMMAMFMMIASGSYLHLGFFAPLYSLAAPIVGTHQMVLYVMHGTFTASGAFVGLMVHMMNSFIFGAILAVMVSRVNLNQAQIIGISVIFALAIEAVFALAILPAIGSTMVHDLGLGSFTIAHLIFGMTIGIALALAKGIGNRAHS